jgi:hypothetical protein
MNEVAIDERQETKPAYRSRKQGPAEREHCLSMRRSAKLPWGHAPEQHHFLILRVDQLAGGDAPGIHSRPKLHRPFTSPFRLINIAEPDGHHASGIELTDGLEDRWRLCRW